MIIKMPKFLVTFRRVAEEECNLLVDAESNTDAAERAMQTLPNTGDEEWYAETVIEEPTVALVHQIPEVTL